MRFTGGIRTTEAVREFELALNGFNQLLIYKESQLKLLEKEGLLIRPENFISWKDEILKDHSFHINELKKLLEE